MRRLTIIFIASIFLLACCLFLWNKRASTALNHRAQPKENVSVQNEYPYKDADINAIIIPSVNNTFGYDIYLDGAMLIHQPSRPGLPGNAGFATQEDAKKVAELVVKKIRNNELPPTVTIEELRGLGVIK